MTLEESLKGSLERLRAEGFTHFKIEPEAVFGRSELEECESCEGEGSVVCSDCDGINEMVCGCDIADCEECEGSGITSCDQCDDGRWECSDCDGDDTWRGEGTSLGDISEYVRGKLTPACLRATTYWDIRPDGSVDTELTATLPLTPKGVEYGIEFIKAFDSAGQWIGNGTDTTNAGMHIAIMNCGTYRPTEQLNQVKARNLMKNIVPMHPALLLLASTGAKSRSLSYRKLGYGELQGYDRYIAINPLSARRANTEETLVGNSNYLFGFEFRIFETCYEKPDMLKDFLCTIEKCISNFYVSRKRRIALPDIPALQMTSDGNGSVGGYFWSIDHIKVLEQTVGVLKPDHRTLEEAMAIRGLSSKCRKKIEEKHKLALVEVEKELDIEYKRFSKQFRSELRAQQRRPHFDRSMFYARRGFQEPRLSKDVYAKHKSTALLYKHINRGKPFLGGFTIPIKEGG